MSAPPPCGPRPRCGNEPAGVVDNGGGLTSRSPLALGPDCPNEATDADAERASGDGAREVCALLLSGDRSICCPLTPSEMGSPSSTRRPSVSFILLASDSDIQRGSASGTGGAGVWSFSFDAELIDDD